MAISGAFTGRSGAIGVRRRDVEHHQLVGPFRFVAFRALDRIAGVANVLEAHTLHNPPVADVEAGDDALGNGARHRSASAGDDEVDATVEQGAANDADPDVGDARQ